MSYSYKETYLGDAMRNLGEMTEYAYYACDVEPDKALRIFIISGYADRFGKGDPCVVSGMSGTELYQHAAEECGLNMTPWLGALVRYKTDVYYWAGYILAYYQWSANRTFGKILSVIKTDDLMRMYPALHTASDERAIEEIEELYRERSAYGRLQEYRKRINMTQAQLAEASGVNIRTLQQYEIGSKSLRKAAAETVFSLADVLGCRPEELIS